MGEIFSGVEFRGELFSWHYFPRGKRFLCGVFSRGLTSDTEKGQAKTKKKPLTSLDTSNEASSMPIKTKKKRKKMSNNKKKELQLIK